VSRLRLVLLVCLAVAVGSIGAVWVASLFGSSTGVALAGEADALCAHYHDAVGSFGAPASLTAVPQLVAREKPLARTLETELEGLDPPRSEAADYGRFLDLVRDQIAYLDAERKAGRAGDEAAFHRAVAASKRAHVRQGRIAKRLKFLVCGR
jgi:hypothetical protein